MMDSTDPFELQRFIDAQKNTYASAVAELQSGRKCSHWMWYIFPQLSGLGYSETSRRFAIKSINEAQAYWRHSILGTRLIECSQIVFLLPDKSAYEIFGSPDDMKLKSCMTLFEVVTDSGTVFAKILDKYFAQERDKKTLQLLGRS